MEKEIFCGANNLQNFEELNLLLRKNCYLFSLLLANLEDKTHLEELEQSLFDVSADFDSLCSDFGILQSCMQKGVDMSN